jgi:hypothetical protein
MKTPTLAILLALGVLSAAEPPPQPPCGSSVYPDYPELDHAPVVKVWERNELGRGWLPAACMGWTEPGFSTLVVTTARFRLASGIEGPLSRFGAISEFKGIQYWSVTHQKWRTLVVNATALSGPNGESRSDFPSAELKEGGRLFFEQEDSLSGKGAYEMRILSASANRVVIDTRNVTTLRYFMVPMFHPGDVESVYFLERESKDVWRYYNMARLGANANPLATGHAASSINRAIAFYRHLAGIPTDQEPPAAK